MLFAKFEECNDDGEGTDKEMETDTDYSVSVPTQFKQLTRELEVSVYTGLPSPETSQFSFDYLREKARSMQYWWGGKQTMKEAPKSFSPSSWQLDLPKEDLGLKKSLGSSRSFSWMFHRNSKWTWVWRHSVEWIGTLRTDNAVVWKTRGPRVGLGRAPRTKRGKYVVKIKNAII